jgi:sn-glycerol 3-phosphate transport system permease protein
MKTEKRKEIKYHIPLVIILFILVWPIAYMVSCSFKSLNEIFTSGLNLIPKNGTIDNYNRVIIAVNFFRYVFNSMLIAVVVTLLKTFTSTLAAYAFSFMKFKHREALFYLFTVTMFIPFTVIMIPNYLTISEVGLLNNPIGVIFPQLADAMGIFLMRQSMRTIPKTLLEAAELDKVSHIKSLTKIVIPLVKPTIFAMGIMFFINSWNEYFWPMLILTGKENYTITLALQMFLSSEGGSAWGSTMALASMATLIPLILYLFGQRFIISTYMSSGIKE